MGWGSRSWCCAQAGVVSSARGRIGKDRSRPFSALILGETGRIKPGMPGGHV